MQCGVSEDQAMRQIALRSSKGVPHVSTITQDSVFAGMD